MHRRLIAAAVFAALCLGAVFIGSYVGVAHGDADGQGVCVGPKNCKDIQAYPSGDCSIYNIHTCVFNQSQDTVIYCDLTDAKCAVIIPYQPQTCTGACKINPGTGCTATLNKCH